MTPPVVVTIAGSDSGGGAGIQADLKTFAAHGCFGASVITAVTAQNTRGVTHVHQLPPEAVASQLDAVLDDLPVVAVKTGMLGSPEVADVVADRARAGKLPNLVVDPVLVSSTGHQLGTVQAVNRLLRYARVATPNIAEASELRGNQVTTVDEMLAAAAELAQEGSGWLVVTGGDLAGGGDEEEAVDAVGIAENGHYLLRGPRVDTRNVHGSGCTFSAAIAARLALGSSVDEALQLAKSYVVQALRGGAGWQIGSGIGPLDHLLWEETNERSSQGVRDRVTSGHPGAVRGGGPDR